MKGKRKQERKSDNKGRPAEGASRDEVREVMRKQDAGGTTLADLLRAAGVGENDEGGQK